MEQFDQVINRKGTHSVKWDMTNTVFGEDDLLPMWVADMDFPPPGAVMEALEERLRHPPFGYTYVPDSTGEAIKQWMDKRHGWSIHLPWLLYSTGVVPSIATVIQALTDEGDQILTFSPVYTPFFDMIKKNNRTLTTSLLLEMDGRHQIDWAHLEESLANGVKMLLLCSPHNPSGRVWTKEELYRLNKLCKEHSVILVSDEIHSDLIFKTAKHVPTALAAENEVDHTITLIAPSKTFNLAGLQASSMIIPNKELRQKIQDAQGKQGFFTLNTFGIKAMEAAYLDGEAWLESLIDYLEENVRLVRKTIKEIPGVTLMEPEGTYLLWIDYRNTGKSDDEVKELLLKKAKLALEPGDKYGEGGSGFTRMNIACSRQTLVEGLKRFKIAFS
ncbi:MalY/PatB family protein [Jeotgalibacillus soli]|uniref:cysteine-S-conjugate beta-lyase n=1 Tax=Jeotgalibacillus soli TaxID=889306 RepID=A0A0C2VF13_9BACL|nr:PatB family C-S lyase [Jeotgalibacillus soli]KIL42588.1 cystathionine beta-lyase [Jeotgalibacillus soli]